jgi:DNA-directed RNA polymerase subunit K/omega
MEEEEEEVFPEDDEDVVSEASEEIVDDDLYNEIYKPRDKKETDKVIVAQNIRTQDKLTLFEYATIVKIRAEHIRQSGNTYTKNAKEFDSPVTLAKKEIDEGMKPLKVLRQIKKNTFEAF